MPISPTVALVGGVGYVWGAIVGAGLVKLLDDYLQVALPALIGTSGSYEIIVFGIVLVLMLKFLPDGLWSMVERYLPPLPRVMVDGVSASLFEVTQPFAVRRAPLPYESTLGLGSSVLRNSPKSKRHGCANGKGQPSSTAGP